MIRTGNMELIQKTITSLGKEIRDTVQSAIELSYYSRGAWTYTDVLWMSAGERQVAAEFINKRLEHASKMPFPVF